MKHPILYTATQVSVLAGSELLTVPRSHANFGPILEAMKNDDFDTVRRLMSPTGRIRESLGWQEKFGAFTFSGDCIKIGSYVFSDAVTEKVLRMIDNGADMLAMRNFLEKVVQNPSSSARTELLLFAEAANFVICPDGDLVGWKGVTTQWMDYHSRSVCNKPRKEYSDEEWAQLQVTPVKCGALKDDVMVSASPSGLPCVSMQRGMVDDRRDVTCSFGLHVASHTYAMSHYGRERVIAVKVDPRDIVAIPNDYANAKARCCAYEIVTELETGRDLTQYEVLPASVLEEAGAVAPEGVDGDDDESGLYIELSHDGDGDGGVEEDDDDDDEGQPERRIRVINPAQVVSDVLYVRLLNRQYVPNVEKETFDDMNMPRSDREWLAEELAEAFGVLPVVFEPSDTLDDAVRKVVELLPK